LAVQQSDGSQLSPFAQILSSLQQLQQSNPSQYQQVTRQIATNLQNAAKTAQSEGNTTAANQLNQLANDFTTALAERATSQRARPGQSRECAPPPSSPFPRVQLGCQFRQKQQRLQHDNRSGRRVRLEPVFERVPGK